ncbi:MAG: zinc metalloprotease HtpX [Armatimonadota bacterium]|nr:zinc metalloprotease HtpX [Armatimonadota bacterium]MCX7776670.1 zinc metalloprotease HtpX [Armatimonadota bacterium]MDW8025715.1 zinc metalloprotease HtpX [Armatimonadota bacterium]
MGNQVKTVLLLGALTGLLILIGDLLGGKQGMLFALIFAALMNFGAWWFSDKIVLAMYRAREANPSEYPRLYSIVRRLTTRANLPMPRIYIIPAVQPNAFATGRNPQHAAVAVTEGLLRLLNDDELEGVLAHELTHVRNRDTLVSAIAATIAGAIMVLARMAQWALWFGAFGENRERGGNILQLIALILLIILAPLAALIIQLAISRSREYMADEGAAHMSMKPLALASALAKLETVARQLPMSDADPSTAHMFIVHPAYGDVIWKLFSTHPPIPERIARLKEIAARMGQLAQ